MQSSLRTSLFILIGLILLTPCAFARVRKVVPNDQIIAVNEKDKSVTIEGQKHATFTADNDTRVLLDGKPATFAKLKKGMRVFIGHKEGSTTASLIDADSAAKKKLK